MMLERRFVVKERTTKEGALIPFSEIDKYAPEGHSRIRIEVSFTPNAQAARTASGRDIGSQAHKSRAGRRLFQVEDKGERFIRELESLRLPAFQGALLPPRHRTYLLVNDYAKATKEYREFRKRMIKKGEE